MPTYVVQIVATFSDTVEVEAEDEMEAEQLAVAEFEQDYTVVNNYGLPWDDVQADGVEEMED